MLALKYSSFTFNSPAMKFQNIFISVSNTQQNQRALRIIRNKLKKKLLHQFYKLISCVSFSIVSPARFPTYLPKLISIPESKPVRSSNYNRMFLF